MTFLRKDGEADESLSLREHWVWHRMLACWCYHEDPAISPHFTFTWGRTGPPDV